jgi:prepilin-type N-terminal cleavage/methylation domain-containing protein
MDFMKKGFGLVEIIIGIALIAILGGGGLYY